uniref:Uncharacterized protein n=1 Tax=Mycena chlorophos TaxID=658473 RepID=A0ABQ0LL01_MYCCL|nr:predicted protein [Mycena chlorophos]
MGGSQASDYHEQELDASDPDSDIPGELQVILSASRATSPTDDTFSFFPQANSTSLPSPGLPPAHLPPPPPPSSSSLSVPKLELPVFTVQLADDDVGHHADIDDNDGVLSEEDTKKSFDFTGELKKLNESGASDRRSFVEQLENAFKTPAKIDLRNFNLLPIDVPPVPPMPLVHEDASMVVDVSGPSSRLMDVSEPTMASSGEGDGASEGISNRAIIEYPSPILDLKEPTLLPGSDSLASDDSLPSPGNGELNVRFKFGGQPPQAQPPKKPLTLSDILVPPAHAHGRAQSLTMLMEEDDSVLQSIFAHAADIPQAQQTRQRVNSDSSLRRSAIENSRVSMASVRSAALSRPASGISFTGFDSFDEVRRGFEYHPNRPTFYPPPAASRNHSRAYHGQHDSVFSIASVSSYGHVTNPGVSDPFEYGLPMPSLREQPSSEDLSVSLSLNVDDTFSFLARDPRRKRVASDASSFYFKAPGQQQQQQPSSAARGHRHRDSNFSVSSQAGPPISFYNYNRSYASHRLSEADTSTSGSSLAHQYAAQGAAGGRAAWAKHHQEASVDSVLSDFSIVRLGRPGVGDKMFDTAYDRSMPLNTISASPAGSSYDVDSILGATTRGASDNNSGSLEDSLFEKTGHRSSMSSDSVFGYDDHHQPNGHLFPPNQFRPLSILSMSHGSSNGSVREDETMITMLGGGHVRRSSIGSVFEASPCVRAEKRKHATFQEDNENGPHKARILPQPSIASTASSKFGDERMIRAKQGLLVRQSLEESALMADGEIGFSLRQAPVFSRPSPDSRSRSSTITSSSSGADTPPLSSAESMSEGGSFSSIDMSELSMRLANTTHPVPSSASVARARTRARGNGHRRRMSAAQSRASRASVYETIHEEYPVASPAPSDASKKSNGNSPTAVFVVPADSGSIDWTPGNGASTGWDDERGIVALRKYYALRNEAEDAVTESKRMWLDTPFSLFALQSFQPPKNHQGMQALLQHSVESYGPLPHEFASSHRRVRSRTQSRPSPYPARQALAQQSPNVTVFSNSPRPSPEELNRAFMSPVQNVEFDANVGGGGGGDPSFSFSTSMLLSPKQDKNAGKAWGLPPRPRVPSAARRSALGWAKRSTKASTDLKENNVNVLNTSGISFVMSPNDSLRISRPRPRGRPTPASARRPVPVA